MYLRSLRLVGFKSFADRTRLEFRPGVTVVVGPNGTGKSNLVDAIAWVMGTQAPSSLRTQRMDDVIFAGTATRPSLGRAEATLTFDNASRQLPLDLDEVAITRRLYRDGTSDYEINGVDCRLLDIQDLLADASVGRTQHVIIGQGQVDSILNAGPDEHRAVIEEAAGVLKHKLRKERSLRRLERTEADLVRLGDLVGEIERRLRPLRRQAQAAGRHQEVAAEIRALRLWIGGEDLRRLTTRQAECSEEERRAAALVADAEVERDESASEVERLDATETELRATVEDDTAAAARLETAVERLRRVAQVAQERRRALVTRLETAGERRSDLEEEAAELARSLEESTAELEAARVEEARTEDVLLSMEAEERSLAEQRDLPAEGAAAVVRGDLRALVAATDRDQREAEDVGRRLEVITAQLISIDQELVELGDEIRSADAEAGKAQTEYEEARARSRLEQDTWEAAEERLGERRVAVAGAAARLEAVQAMVEGQADPEARARALLRPEVTGPLLERLDVPPPLAMAVGAALGRWADAVAVAAARDIEAVVVDLVAGELGGIALVAPVGQSVPIPTDAVALTSRLGPGADPALARAVFGDVVLAETWSAGWSVVTANPELRAVTPAGDLITAVGIDLALPQGASPAVLAAASAAAKQADVELARAESLHTSTRRSFDLARHDERAALEALEAIETRLAGGAQASQRLEHARSARSDERQRLEQRLSAIFAEENERNNRIEALRSRLDALEGEEAERVAAWEGLAEMRRQAAVRRADAQRAKGAAAAARGAVEERRSQIEWRLNQVQVELTTLLAAPADPHEVGRLEGIEIAARRGLDAVRHHLARLRARQADGRSGLAELIGQLRHERQRNAAARGVIDGNRELLARLAVEKAELALRLEGVAEALRRDADAGEDEARQAPRPMIPDDTDPVERLAALEALKRRLGPVNPLAVEEHAELSERYQFLGSQVEDLERSRRELRRVISVLDDEISGLFLAAFEEIRVAYEAHFDVLFPGGRGRLRLSDPSDPLASGVEIEAQPLGKKVGRLSLLSGGERSLAALAFLFAVFEARPGPFYVLDEVEAALDDANLRRFLRLVDRFRSRAQLVIVTHQQQTMEVADTLYGVTMEPGGSSSVVSRRMREGITAAH
jgi:chromosome segregation protein